MGRPRNEPPRPSGPPKCYPVVVSNPDIQAAFETLAQHQNRPDVASWLYGLGRLYASLYLAKRGQIPKTLKPWMEGKDV